MSAHNCGCDPEAKWVCRDYPACSYGKALDAVKALMQSGIDALDRQDDVLEDMLMSETTDVERPNDTACGRANKEMSLNEYQRSLHTYKDRHQECHALGIAGELAEVFKELYDVVLAAGNIADMVKKAVSHDVPADREKLKKELGDVLWYITAVASDNALTMDDIAKANIAKLQERYPNGFVKGGGVRTAEGGSMPFLRELQRQGIVARVDLPPVKKAHAVHFSCGCSETVVDGVLTRRYCPNGECRKLTR